MYDKSSQLRIYFNQHTANPLSNRTTTDSILNSLGKIRGIWDKFHRRNLNVEVRLRHR
ncbi:MAG: hypothetical protein WBF52_16760 [Geitlerinemataceae cyanobacterium]